MDNLIHLFAIAVVLATILAGITVWSPRKTWVKTCAVVTSAAFIAVAYAAFADLLSKPKPVSLEWANRHVSEAIVLGATAREGEGIFVWLQFDGAAEPRSYVMPWSRPAAEQLQKALSEAEESGAGVGLRLPFEPSWDEREPRFYAVPQPALPPKDRDLEGPTFYRHPGLDA